ncbi:MAG: hypothetical protein HQM08_28125 [Candidatus Riflebacteria bacterium]|nr:hypothetical protein [Candidatus Riflebacteria bacterium]
MKIKNNLNNLVASNSNFMQPDEVSPRYDSENWENLFQRIKAEKISSDNRINLEPNVIDPIVVAKADVEFDFRIFGIVIREYKVNRSGKGLRVTAAGVKSGKWRTIFSFSDEGIKSIVNGLILKALLDVMKKIFSYKVSNYLDTNFKKVEAHI